jgi:hypothetical protein
MLRSRDSQPQQQQGLFLPAAAPALTATSIRNSVLAGYVAGITGTLVGYPLDSAKVWLQTSSNNNACHTARPPTILTVASSSSGAAATNNSLAAIAFSPSTTTNARAIGNRAASTLACAIMPTTTNTTLSSSSTTVTNAVQTIRSLYKGVACPLLTVGLVQSANFAIYDSVRRMLYSWDNHGGGGTSHTGGASDYLHHDSLFHVGVASMTAGAVLAVITSPLVMIKTKQQVQQISFLQASRQTFFSRNDNAWCWRTASRGLGPHFVAETVGRAIYFTAYERCKRHLSSKTGDRLSLSARMGSAALSGMLCWTLIFPLDVLRNRLYAANTTTGENAWTMSARIYREHGFKGFFRGYAISVVRAGPVAAMILPVYDHVLDMLQPTSL